MSSQMPISVGTAIILGGLVLFGLLEIFDPGTDDCVEKETPAELRSSSVHPPKQLSAPLEQESAHPKKVTVKNIVVQSTGPNPCTDKLFPILERHTYEKDSGT